MKLTCEFCGGYVSDHEENCPHCGAKNAHYKRQGKGVPKTIEELQQWYEDHNLPPKNVTRFYIGENYKKPKAFGIYQDGEEFVVYKNKDNGARAERYRGNDEAYAVNELYLKLKEVIAQQKAANRNHSGGRVVKKESILDKLKRMLVGSGFCVFIILFAGFLGAFIPNRGYYHYQGCDYYYLDDWYIYDTYSSSWEPTHASSELNSHYSDYYSSSSYRYDASYSDFKDTSYYIEWESNDWDSDSSWSSSDSWSSSSTDWSSDW